MQRQRGKCPADSTWLEPTQRPVSATAACQRTKSGHAKNSGSTASAGRQGSARPEQFADVKTRAPAAWNSGAKFSAKQWKNQFACALSAFVRAVSVRAISDSRAKDKWHDEQNADCRIKRTRARARFLLHR